MFVQFIRYIFHEVRVPLNAVILAIEQLKEFGSLNSSASEIVDILREQATVVSRILNDVLTIQRIEEGKLSLQFETFSIRALCEGTIRSFRTASKEKHIKWHTNLPKLDEWRKLEESLNSPTESTVFPSTVLSSLTTTPIAFDAQFAPLLVCGDKLR